MDVPRWDVRERDMRTGISAFRPRGPGLTGARMEPRGTSTSGLQARGAACIAQATGLGRIVLMGEQRAKRLIAMQR